MTPSPLIRVAAGTLLLTERKTAKDMSRDVRESIDQAAARAREQKMRAALLLLLLSSSHKMARRLHTTISARRQAARAAAIGRLRRELTVAGIAGIAAANLGNGSARAQDDDAYAQSSSDSLAAAWRGLAIASVVRALHKDQDPVTAIGSTSRTMMPRVLRTAATETAQAYSDEHRAALEDAVEYDKTYRDGAFAEDVSGMMRQWSAILDTRTCVQCSALDGETAEVGGSFKSGYEPGFVHTLCRCIDVYVPRSDVYVPRSQAMKEAA